ncbi:MULTISPECIES: TetR/AcrR family transcriptional regulator [Cohnella]|uniref:TetR/AcrR family transcriptional regulator n=1 Tax=Cohnella TaxID=329857 RepID=UPI0009BB62AC|nr:MULTISPECIES: TetR family transcriptional regulator [Cohnella]MBN2980164.1 helix-turn-helix transcriptional regulator [Cohnella algarum]
MDSAEQDVKLRLLLAAKKLFAQQGFDRTTTRQVAEEAGANVALISYYFGGKEKIFEAIFEFFLPKELILESLNRSFHPVEGICFIIEQVTHFRYREPELMLIVQQEISLGTPRRELVRKHMFPIWGKLRDLLEEGRRCGVFRFRSLDHAFLSVLGTILFHKKSDYFQPLMTEAPQSAQELVDHLTDYVLGGLHFNGDGDTQR